MAEFKLVISDPKSGKSKQIQLSEENSKNLLGKKIKNTIKGESIDMPGYEFVITGGSDVAGFPMRNDINGTNRIKILSGKSVGIKKLRNKNDRIRKTVAGNTIYTKTAQINLKITKMGTKSLFEEEKAEEKTENSENSEKKTEDKETKSKEDKSEKEEKK